MGKSFGQRFRAHRLAIGLEANKIAVAIGVSRGFIYNVEQEVRGVSDVVLRKLGDYKPLGLQYHVLKAWQLAGTGEYDGNVKDPKIVRYMLRLINEDKASQNRENDK